MTRIKQRVACVASVSVWFQSKERLRSGIFGFAAREMKRETILRAVFDSRSSFFAPNIARRRLPRRLDKRSSYPGTYIGKTKRTS